MENISLALAGLKSSKMRSFLTMLGIIIGIASVIAIVTVGNSLTSSITGTMEELGANQIQAYVMSKESNTNRSPQARDLMTDEMIEEVVALLGDDLSGAHVSQGAGSGQIKDGRRYANVNITGLSAGGLEASNVTVLKGHDILVREIKRGSKTAIISSKTAEAMFPPTVDPLGQEIKVHTGSLGVQTFTVVGVYEYKIPAFLSAFVSEDDMPTDIYIPVTTAKRMMGVAQGHQMVAFMFPPEKDSKEITKKISDFFETKYRSNQQFSVGVQNMEGIMSQFTTMLGTLAIAISIIAGISLIVGGIGVMNIMLVSVTERTREIGTRKALGAKSSAIRIQFITESMILCLVGGVIGIILGLLLGALGAFLLNAPASPSLPIILIAVGFSMAIGVFFGFYPANKAAQLNPIDALRYE